MAGPVIGNYTTNGSASLMDLPYAAPPYQSFPANATLPVDDKGRVFPGNAGNDSDVLDVQCANRTSTVSCSSIADLP